MCQIIMREAGVVVSPQRIISAATRNKDGWGMAVLDRGKLEVSKHHSPQGNNPDDILKALEQAKDHRVYLHMRYTTKGSSGVENCHPFNVHVGNGSHIILMHNGTMHDFGNSEVSDTRDYVDKVLAPFAEMYYRQKNVNDVVFNDPLFCFIQDKFGKGWSKFLFADNAGNFKIFGEDKDCVKEEGFWASNSYSFAEPKPDTPVVKNHYYFPNYTKTIVHSSSAIPPKEDNVTNLPVVKNKEKKVEPEEEPVETFVERWDNNFTLEEICLSMDTSDINDLVQYYPEEAAMLIRDLIYVLYGGAEEEHVENVKASVVS